MASWERIGDNEINAGRDREKCSWRVYGLGVLLVARTRQPRDSFERVNNLSHVLSHINKIEDSNLANTAPSNTKPPVKKAAETMRFQSLDGWI